MPTGDQLGGYLDPIILAFEDAMNEGRLNRPVERLALHATFGPHDHRGYRGDFPLMKQLRNVRFDFAAYHRPQWPTNGPRQEE